MRFFEDKHVQRAILRAIAAKPTGSITAHELRNAVADALATQMTPAFLRSLSPERSPNAFKRRTNQPQPGRGFQGGQMRQAKNLIQLQEEAVEAILAVPQNGPRAAMYRLSFLNRRPKALRAIHCRFDAAAHRLGYTFVQTEAQWNDVRDIAALRENAQEAQ